ARNDVVQVCYDIERRDQITRFVIVRKFFSSAVPDVLQPALAAERERVFGNVNSFCVAELGEHHEIRSRAAAYVEDARGAILYLAADSFDKTRYDAAAAYVPPVRFLYLVENRVGVLHHLTRQRFGK